MHHQRGCRAILGLVTVLVTIYWPGLRFVAGDASAVPAKPAVDSLGDSLPVRALLRLGTRRFHHPSSVIDLALSPDEKTVVTVGSDELIAWNAATGKMLWRTNVQGFPGAAYGIRALAFAADSSRFYTPGERNEVFIWTTATGEHQVLSVDWNASGNLAIRPDNPRFDRPKAIDVTSDGRRLALGSAQSVIVCDEKGKLLYEIANGEGTRITNEAMSRDRLLFGGPYSFGRFSPDQKLLAVVGSDAPEEIRFHSAETGKLQKRLKLKSRLVRLDFSPDSRQVVTTERDIAVRLYDIEAGKEIWSFVIDPKNTAESYTSAVAYLPNLKMIAAGAPIGSENYIQLLDVADGKPLGKLVGHAWKPWALAMTKGDVLYSSGWDGAIRRWDLRTQQQLPLPQGIRGTGVVTASPNGRSLAYVDDSGKIHLVSAQDGTELSSFQVSGTAYSQLTFSADNNFLAGGGIADDQVHVAIWDLRNGEVSRRWDWPKGKDPHSDVESLQFSPDGMRLAAAVFRQSFSYLWDLTTGEQINQLPHNHVYGLSFSPDNQTLATAGWDNTVRFWKSSSGEMIRQINLGDGQNAGNDNRMYTVCYAPKGGLLATAHLDGRVRIWNAADMELRKEFRVQGRFVYGSIAFSPDGYLLATGSMAGDIALWDPLAGEKVWVVGSHEHYVYTLSFGSDNRTLVSGGQDGVAYRWNLQPRGSDEPPKLDTLWKKLDGDGQAAYEAMWEMKRIPEQAVSYLGKKLRPVSRVMDLDQIVMGLPADEAERRQRLVRMMAEKDDKVILSSVARRATVALGQLETDDSQRLLKELAERDPESKLGKLAAAALARAREK